MEKKWFYIIQRNGFVTELNIGQEAFKGLVESWRDGSKIIAIDLNGDPVAINSVDVSNILGEDSYIRSYVDTVNPKTYITRGVWKSTKHHSPVRYEKWKEKEMREIAKLASPEEQEISELERKNVHAKIDKIRSEIMQKWQ